MTTIKSYTDLEQSKKLADILPIESADYHYITQGEESYFYPYSLSSDAVKDYDEEINYIPCWSLAALLDVLPNYKLNSEHNYHTCTAGTNFGNELVGWYDNPVDACYEMILKLHELNLL